MRGVAMGGAGMTQCGELFESSGIDFDGDRTFEAVGDGALTIHGWCPLLVKIRASYIGYPYITRRIEVVTIRYFPDELGEAIESVIVDDRKVTGIRLKM